MASITLKNIPEPLHCVYKRRAKAHSRSLQAEILHTLAKHVATTDEDAKLAVEDVVGMLKPQRKGVTIQQMHHGIDQSLRKSWK
ncbi:MAG: FitA-like ribbon-helix-helix domain-containing protein [Luteolibacter sp.]